MFLDTLDSIFWIRVAQALSLPEPLDRATICQRAERGPDITWLRVSGSGFRVSGFGFRISDFGIRVSGLRGRGRVQNRADGKLVLVLFRKLPDLWDHTVEHDTFIKSQLASRGQL